MCEPIPPPCPRRAPAPTRSWNGCTTGWPWRKRPRAPEFAALTRLGEAERTRLDDGADGHVGRWEVAVAAFDALGDPVRAAYARVGLAEALLAGRDPQGRAAATAALRSATEVAERLAAVPLAQETTRVARRGGIDLDGTAYPAQSWGLTPRELEVLRVVAAGRSNREIGTALWISTKTASVHVSNILAKLTVHPRVEAAALALREGLPDG